MRGQDIRSDGCQPQHLPYTNRFDPRGVKRSNKITRAKKDPWPQPEPTNELLVLWHVSITTEPNVLLFYQCWNLSTPRPTSIGAKTYDKVYRGLGSASAYMMPCLKMRIVKERKQRNGTNSVIHRACRHMHLPLGSKGKAHYCSHRNSLLGKTTNTHIYTESK